MSRIHRWSPGDELPSAPPPIAGDDDGWWACGLKAAAVAITVALSFAQDEIAAPPPPLTVADDVWQVPVPALPVPRAASFAVGDDIVPQQVVGAGLPFDGQRARHAPKFQRWFVPDDLPAPAVAAVPDEAYAWPPIRALTVEPVVRVWFDEGLRPTPAAALTVDETHWQRPIVLTPRPQPAHASDEPIVPSLRVTDDHWQEPFSRSDTTVVLWAEDEPIVPHVRLSDDYWQPPIVHVKTPVALVVRHQDEVVTAAAPLPADEGTWQRPIVVAAPVAQPAQQNEDIVPQPKLTEDYWQRPYHVPVAPVARVWTHQDEVPLPAVPLPVDDMPPWQAPIVWRTPVRATAFADLEWHVFPPPVPETPRGGGGGGGRRRFTDDQRLTANNSIVSLIAAIVASGELDG